MNLMGYSEEKRSSFIECLSGKTLLTNFWSNFTPLGVLIVTDISVVVLEICELNMNWPRLRQTFLLCSFYY